MYPMTVKSFALLAALFSMGDHAGASGHGIKHALQPVILKVTTDFQAHRMIIAGRHFGHAEPTVRLAHRVLPVQSAAEDQVVVSLPSSIRPATYGLTVTAAGPDHITSEVFSTALFALD